MLITNQQLAMLKLTLSLSYQKEFPWHHWITIHPQTHLQIQVHYQQKGTCLSNKSLTILRNVHRF